MNKSSAIHPEETFVPFFGPSAGGLDISFTPDVLLLLTRLDPRLVGEAYRAMIPEWIWARRGASLEFDPTVTVRADEF